MAQKFAISSQSAGFISFQNPITDSSTYSGPDIYTFNIPDGMVCIGGNGRGFTIPAQTLIINNIKLAAEGKYVLYASAPSGSDTEGVAVVDSNSVQLLKDWIGSITDIEAWKGDDSGRRAIATFTVRLDGSTYKIDQQSLDTFSNYNSRQITNLLEDYGIYDPTLVNDTDLGIFKYRGQQIIPEAALNTGVNNFDLVYYDGSEFQQASANDTSAEMIVGIAEKDREATADYNSTTPIPGRDFVMTSGIIDVGSTTSGHGSSVALNDGTVFQAGTYLYLSGEAGQEGKIVRDFEEWRASNAYTAGDQIIAADGGTTYVLTAKNSSSSDGTQTAFLADLGASMTIWEPGAAETPGTNYITEGTLNWRVTAVHDENFAQNIKKVRIGIHLGNAAVGGGALILFQPGTAGGATAIDDHEESAHAHTDIQTTLEKAGLYVWNVNQGKTTKYRRGQYFDEDATLTTVTDQEFAYVISDGNYGQAIDDNTDAASNLKKHVVGMVDIRGSDNYVISSGYVYYDTTSVEGGTADEGDEIFLSATTDGATSLVQGRVKLGTVVRVGTYTPGSEVQDSDGIININIQLDYRNLLESHGIFIDSQDETFVGQTIDTIHNIDATVSQFDPVYFDGTVYKRADADDTGSDGNRPNQPVGISLLNGTGVPGQVATSGIVNLDNTILPTGTFDGGDVVYCPNTPGAAYSATDTGVIMGYCLGNNQMVIRPFNTSATSDFLDNVFRVSDSAVSTKKLAFELTGVTAGNTRTITIPDHDLNLTDVYSGGTSTKVIGIGDFASATIDSVAILHVASGTAGVITPSTASDEFIVEGAGNVGLSILSPDANSSSIRFASPTNNEGAVLNWNYDNSTFGIYNTKTGSTIVFATEGAPGPSNTVLILDGNQAATFKNTVMIGDTVDQFAGVQFQTNTGSNSELWFTGIDDLTGSYDFIFSNQVGVNDVFRAEPVRTVDTSLIFKTTGELELQSAANAALTWDGEAKVLWNGSTSLDFTMEAGTGANAGYSFTTKGAGVLQIEGTSSPQLSLVTTGDFTNIINAYSARTAADDNIFVINGWWTGSTSGSQLVGKIAISGTGSSSDIFGERDEGYITLQTAEGGSITERLRVSANGNVGIGAFGSDPVQSIFHVHSGDAGSAISLAIGSDDLLLESAGDTGMTIATPINQTSSILFQSVDTSSSSNDQASISWLDGSTGDELVISTNDAAGSIKFKTTLSLPTVEFLQAEGFSTIRILSQSTVTANDIVGHLDFYVTDAGGVGESARIYATNTETVSASSNVDGKLFFQTATDNTLIDGLTIDQSQNVVVPSGNLTISGTGTFTSGSGAVSLNSATDITSAVNMALNITTGVTTSCIISLTPDNDVGNLTAHLRVQNTNGTLDFNTGSAASGAVDSGATGLSIDVNQDVTIPNGSLNIDSGTDTRPLSLQGATSCLIPLIPDAGVGGPDKTATIGTLTGGTFYIYTGGTPTTTGSNPALTIDLNQDVTILNGNLTVDVGQTFLTSTNARVLSLDCSTGGSGCIIDMTPGSGTTVTASLQVVNNTGDLILYTNGTVGGPIGTSALEIDGSTQDVTIPTGDLTVTAGRLNITNGVSFLATDVSQSITSVNATTLIYDTAEVFDSGADFIPGTGVFTAPVAGRYLFNYNCGVSGININQQLDILIATSLSGDFSMASIYRGTETRASIGGSIILDLSAGESVKIRADSGSDNAYTILDQVFSGCLLAY